MTRRTFFSALASLPLVVKGVLCERVKTAQSEIRVSFEPMPHVGEPPNWFSFDQDGVFVVSVNDGKPFAVTAGVVHTEPIKKFSIYGVAHQGGSSA